MSEAASVMTESTQLAALLLVNMLPLYAGKANVISHVGFFISSIGVMLSLAMLLKVNSLYPSDTSDSEYHVDSEYWLDQESISMGLLFGWAVDVTVTILGTLCFFMQYYVDVISTCSAKGKGLPALAMISLVIIASFVFVAVLCIPVPT